MVRTKEELEQALSNASEARSAVFELFQDLDGFSLDDYLPLSDTKSGMNELMDFVQAAAIEYSQQMTVTSDSTFSLMAIGGSSEAKFTTDRDLSLNEENVELLGLDHQQVVEYLNEFRSVKPCLLYTSPSPRDQRGSRMPSSA